MIDGAKRYKYNFYGYIVHSKNRLFYFQIKHLNSADSKTISIETSKIINFIQNELDIEIISICTDHASNIKKVFNPAESFSSQILTNSFFEWIGCFSHLLNLCINDLFKDDEFKKYFEILNSYLNICKENEWPNIPTFCKTRWESLAKCFNTIFSFQHQIIAILNTKIRDLNNKLNYQLWPNLNSTICELSKTMYILQNGFLNPKFLETAKIIAYISD